MSSKIHSTDVSCHLFVRQVEQKLPVEASRPPECWVDRIKSICSTDDHYLPTTVQTVHQGQKSGHNRTKEMEDRGKKRNCHENRKFKKVLYDI